jgi:flagellar hook-associated protein 2
VVDLLDAQNKSGGALEGSPLVRTIRSRLGSTMTARVDTGGTFGVAAEIGLSLDRFGRMSFDASKLDDAIEQDYQSVLQLFIAASEDGEQGIAAAIKTTVDGINATSNGLLRFRREAMNDEIKRIDSRIERDSRSIELYAQTLNRKFTAMEQTISRLRAQSGFLFN